MKTYSKWILLLFAVFTFTLTSCKRIDAGHEGIKVNMFGTNKGVDKISLVMNIQHSYKQSIIQHLQLTQKVDWRFKWILLYLLRL